jgi:DNA-binding MarR family transcriptional regulator
MSDPETLEAPLRRAQDEVSEVFAAIAEFWGFTRTQGRIYGLLFTSPEPLGHREIRDRLEISAGSVSMTLASLVQWGVLHRRGRLYDAETDLWSVITGVLRRREREHVELAIGRISAVVESLREAARSGSPRLIFVLGRTERLLEFFKLGHKFLEAFVVRNPLHGLLETMARRAAKFSSLLPSREHDVRIGV